MNRFKYQLPLVLSKPLARSLGLTQTKRRPSLVCRWLTVPNFFLLRAMGKGNLGMILRKQYSS